MMPPLCLKDKDILTCFNEKVQIKTAKTEPFSLHPPTWPAPILETVTNTKPNSFVMAALNSSSHKLHGSYI